VTYSIVARDPETGELGVAVQSHWFAAGSQVMWAEAGVGAVATQAMVEPAYGPRGLSLMREGRSASAALDALVGADEGRDHRQVAMVDARGEVAAHTGARCMREAGHRTAEGVSAQANMMLRATVWQAMIDAFEASPGPDLAHRLLDALDAAEAEGGDIRGRQAAGILVVRATPSGRPWEDVALHFRVDDHPEPLAELRRLVELKGAYERLEAAERLEIAGDLAGALREQQAALAAYPDHAEIAFWTALGLAAAGRLDQARRTIQVAYREHAGWAELLRRLAQDGFLDLPQERVAALLPEEG